MHHGYICADYETLAIRNVRHGDSIELCHLAYDPRSVLLRNDTTIYFGAYSLEWTPIVEEEVYNMAMRKFQGTFLGVTFPDRVWETMSWKELENIAINTKEGFNITVREDQGRDLVQQIPIRVWDTMTIEDLNNIVVTKFTDPLQYIPFLYCNSRYLSLFSQIKENIMGPHDVVVLEKK